MRRLPKTAKSWLMKHYTGGQLHTSEDYPRVLEAQGFVERVGPGVLGHTHCLQLTSAGKAESERLLISRLLCRPWGVER